MATIRKRNGKYQVQVELTAMLAPRHFTCRTLRNRQTKQEIMAFTRPENRPRYQPANFENPKYCEEYIAPPQEGARLSRLLYGPYAKAMDKQIPQGAVPLIS